MRSSGLTRLDVEVDHHGRRPLDALELLIEKPLIDVPMCSVERERGSGATWDEREFAP